MNNPIDCELHDYIEIACLFRYEVLLTLFNGNSVQGTALTTQTLKNKSEILNMCTGEGVEDVPFHTIAKIDVTTANARFQSINFEKVKSFK